MDQAQFHQFTDTLKNTLASDERVLALVAIGSLANPERIDRWSDHDFWVITTTAAQSAFLSDLSWLPDHTDITLTLRPAQQYYTILYQNGHIAEFAVFGPHDLARGRLSQYQMLFDKQNIAAQLHVIATQVQQERRNTDDAGAVFGHFLLTLCTGAGRAARGEQLSASTYLFQYAVDELLKLVIQYVPPQQLELVDVFDRRRRFELIYPEISTSLLPILALPPIEAAQHLLTLAEQLFANETIMAAPKALESTRMYLQGLDQGEA